MEEAALQMEWLETIPAVSVYLIVGLVIGLESLGIPLPGEIVLVSSALLAATQDHINPLVLGAVRPPARSSGIPSAI